LLIAAFQITQLLNYAITQFFQLIFSLRMQVGGSARPISAIAGFSISAILAVLAMLAILAISSAVAR
jgi:hypothetical protein